MLMPDTVFLSYRRGDAGAAGRLKKRLEDAGFKVWMDTDSIIGSPDWVRKISEGICDSLAVIFFLTSAWEDSDGFVHNEVKLALEVEKRLLEGRELIVPVLMTDGEPPDLLESRQYINYRNEDDAGFAEILRALQLVLEHSRKMRDAVTPEFRKRCWSYLDYQRSVKIQRLIPACETLSTILIGALVIETGLLQEWAPPSQHPVEFPGWLSASSLMAICCSFLAGIFAGLINRHFLNRARQISRTLAQCKERFYSLAIKAIAAMFIVSFLLLLPTANTIPREGDFLPRPGALHIAKSLIVTCAIVFFLFWPGWFFGLWVKRGCIYHKPSALVPRASSVMLIMMIAIIGMGSWQWHSWKNPLEAGYGDAWRTAHMIIQAVLMTALACIAWLVLDVAEDWEKKGRILEQEWHGHSVKEYIRVQQL